jgi:hypothetical protein
MTSTTQDRSPAQPTREGRAARVVVREMWATVAIVSMWVAVLFVGVFGGDMHFNGVDTSSSTMPAGVGVALFAAIGTGSVAKRVFGRTSDRSGSPA